MFWPNEERSNIALRDGKRAESNQRLMKESMILLKNFIVDAIANNFKGIHNLICIQTPEGSNQAWYKKEVIIPIVSCISDQTVIEGNQRLLKMQETIFPEVCHS